MVAVRKNFKEDVLKAISEKEGIGRRGLRIQIRCGEKQLRDVVDKLVVDKKVHIYRRIKGMCLFTYQYAKDHNIPSKEKRKSKVYGMQKARLEGKKLMTATAGQRLVDSLWFPSRSAT